MEAGEAAYSAAEVHSAVSELSQLLGAENSAVLSGSFSQLGDIAPRKMALASMVEEFVRTSPDEIDEALRADIAALQRECHHNGRILKAAYNGSLAAQNRLGDLAIRQGEVGAYGADGRALVSSQGTMSREKTV